MAASTRQDDVLEQLDAAQSDYLLPAPGNANFPSAALRMDAFAAEAEWLLVFQMLAWHRAGARFIVDVTAYGSDLPEDQRHLEIETPTAPEGERLFGDSSEDLRLDPHDFTVVIRDDPAHFTFTDQDYADAGIDLSDMAKPLAVLRMLAEREADRLLLSPDELTERLGRAGLTHLFTLDEWRHVDEAEDELPSASACFREIAEIIAAGEPRTPIACADDSNTHWSHWVKFER